MAESSSREVDLADVQKYHADAVAAENEIFDIKELGPKEEAIESIRKAKDDDADDEDIEQTTEVIALRSKITLYLASPRFANYLKQCGFNGGYVKKFDKMTKNQLTRDLTRIKTLIQSKSSTKFVENTLFMGCSALEAANPNFAGLTENVKNSDDILDCVDEIRIDQHERIFIESPYKRLALLLLFKGYQQHSINKLNALGLQRLEQTSSQVINLTQSELELLKPQKQPKKTQVPTTNKTNTDNIMPIVPVTFPQEYNDVIQNGGNGVLF